MKVKDNHRSKFSNFNNSKEEAWKKSGLQRDSNPWPPRYRCDALQTKLWSHTLGARYRGDHGFESRWSPDFFQAFSFQLFKLENLLRWSSFTFIYYRSTNMNYFIYTSRHFTPRGRYELKKLTLLPVWGFIAQLVEHRTGIAEVTESNPVESLIFFRRLLCNCLNLKIYCDDHPSLSSLSCYW